ncbi:hypothetical protein BG015_004919 [Linnemannia schmuckeri]|uniref:Uncharacterized protein n=1 Tax=Linnemannia schmuckeri TaxID=64567 RepID=A0A9P5UXY7_9FUNG|nr:hypothetical protein BG015_004919 [Linnemannia schmuckeri]
MCANFLRFESAGSDFKMSFKVTHLIVLAFAMLLVAMGMHQVEAQKLPIWCVCDNVDYTRVLCQPALARGNFDGGSCGMDKQESYNRFSYWCKNAKDSKHQLHCWN